MVFGAVRRTALMRARDAVVQRVGAAPRAR
jgi:hypothetical protein